MKFTLVIFVIFATSVCGKYEIALDRMDDNCKNDLFDFTGLRIKKFNRTLSVITGFYSIFQPFDNELSVGIEAYNLQGGQYKLQLNKVFGKFCDFIWEDHLKEEVENFLSTMNGTIAYNDCPIVPHSGYIDNYAPQGGGDYLPEYIPGNERWKLTYFFIKNNEKIGTCDFYFLLRNEKSLYTNISSG